MKDMLRAEPVPFEFVDAEMSKTENWRLPSGTNLNFTLKIDRLDRAGGKLRFVDYKTGSDELDFNPSNLMPPGRYTHREGIFQLLTYCFAYKSLIGAENDEMQPLIYKIRQTPTDGSTFPPLNLKESRQKPVPLLSYAQVADWFEPLFCSMIEEIFNPEVPFRKTDLTAGTGSPCNYCPFKTTCLV
ncbi:MAG: PD-(D/E)XK nuclease family protein [Muribaculaceae bacterium]|nr:PD-(D/E)XK nuclease family protein [Muribaculaceae bacterium]